MEKYKRSPKLTTFCDRASQCWKGTKVARQTTKMYQKCHLFIYFISRTFDFTFIWHEAICNLGQL